MINKLLNFHLLLSLAAAFSCSVANAAGPMSVRFVTFNVAFTNTNKQIKADVQLVAPKADVMMFQEAKGVTIDNFLDNSWTVYQVVNQGDAKRGSALAIRNSILEQKLAQGLTFGVGRNGEDLLDRYIAWMDVKLTNGRTLRIMSLHMPPRRVEYLQPLMATNFNNFANATPYPIVAGGDWNFNVNDDKWGIEAATGLVSRGVGIDGFYRTPGIVKFDDMFELAGLGVNSDHDPVQLVTTVTAPDSGISDWSMYE